MPFTSKQTKHYHAALIREATWLDRAMSARLMGNFHRAKVCQQQAALNCRIAQKIATGA